MCPFPVGPDAAVLRIAGPQLPNLYPDLVALQARHTLPTRRDLEESVRTICSSLRAYLCAPLLDVYSWADGWVKPR